MAPSMRAIKILCKSCRTLLYRYNKRGTGALVKCYEERILADFTNRDLRCPSCGQVFARRRMIRGKPAHKIIQGKIFTRGMTRK
jgi:hypothetical protein